MRPTFRTASLMLLAVATASCTHAFFSGLPYPDESRPVVRIETRGGVEYGASTDEGILFLGRTATEGPCRVTYFLGEVGTPVVESGEIEHWGGIYYRADIGVQAQSVPLLERPPADADALVALVHEGTFVRSVPVKLAHGEGISGDLLAWPGTSLPAGTGVFAAEDGSLSFVGLVSGEITLSGDGGDRKLLAYAGTDRLREALATPTVHPAPTRIEYRPDGMVIVR